MKAARWAAKVLDLFEKAKEKNEEAKKPDWLTQERWESMKLLFESSKFKTKSLNRSPTMKVVFIEAHTSKGWSGTQKGELSQYAREIQECSGDGDTITEGSIYFGKFTRGRVPGAGLGASLPSNSSRYVKREDIEQLVSIKKEQERHDLIKEKEEYRLMKLELQEHMEILKQLQHSTCAQNTPLLQALHNNNITCSSQKPKDDHENFARMHHFSATLMSRSPGIKTVNTSLQEKAHYTTSFMSSSPGTINVERKRAKHRGSLEMEGSMPGSSDMTITRKDTRLVRFKSRKRLNQDDIMTARVENDTSKTDLNVDDEVDMYNIQKTNIVAQGKIISKDPLHSWHFSPIGEGFYLLKICTVFNPKEELIKSNDEVTKLEHVTGLNAPWPKALLVRRST